MANHRRLPDPPYTPPNEAENDLGYWFVCAGCDRVWSQRYIDQRTKRCLPCARAWRRDDMASRRRGLPGVPLTKNPPAHPFKSRVLRREVNLNSADTQAILATNEQFRAEVDAYIGQVVAKNAAAPAPPLHGVLPLLSRSRTRGKAQRVEISDDEPTRNPAAEVEVDALVNGVMNTIEGEIVDEEPRKKRR